MIVTVLVSGSADTQSLSISMETARSGIGTTLLYQSLKYIVRNDNYNKINNNYDNNAHVLNMHWHISMIGPILRQIPPPFIDSQNGIITN